MIETQEVVRKQRIFVRRLLRWGRDNRRAFPWRGESDPFRILVAEVLLQRSRGVTVAKVYDELFNRWPTATHLAEADVSAIEAVIRPLGLTRRAVWLKRMAAQVVEFGGVPSSVREMLRLAGVGRYAATATASIAFRQPRATVDGTSARVYRRYFGVFAEREAQVDDQLWNLAGQVAPRRAAREWNWAVLDLAASVCLPKVPKCTQCPLRTECSVGSTRVLDLATASG